MESYDIAFFQEYGGYGMDTHIQTESRDHPTNLYSLAPLH